ncbi:MAG: histidine kinase N-terminal 7TM domain-containing protein, partial [Candidatus Margulisbacteria bacterium]|nr:histidine kinase N-terminal 7TM domain-containing protein [Candidatus Margulisiibacteriota bacterium]
MQLDVGLYFILLLFLVQTGLGVYVLLRTARTRSTVSFALLCFSLSLWALPAFMLNNARTVAQVEFWGRYIFLGPVLMAYFFLYFSFVFPRGNISKTLKYLLACPMVFFLFIVPSSLILKEGGLKGIEPSPVWGPFYLWFGFYFLFYFIWGIGNLTWKYLVSRGNEKNQIRYVFAGLILAFLFGVIFNLVFPTLGISKFVNFGPGCTLFLAGFTAYAIIKTRLMDISVIISRTVAEIFAIFIHGIVDLAIVSFYRSYASTVIDLPFLALTVLYGIIVGQTHQNIRLFVQTTSDKVFLHGRYDYYRALSDASSRAGEKLSLPDILKVLYDTFHEVMEISGPRVFLPEHFTETEKISGRYLVYRQADFLPDEKGQAVRIDGPLATAMVARREPMLEVKEIDAALVVPCLLEERLIAFFALGPKFSEDNYTEEDLRLLKVLANQAAITLDHTRSYEKIKADLEIAERQLERSHRLASLGTLTAGVTHEIRNPLTVIRAETERLA